MADRLKVTLDWTLKVHTKVDFPADEVVKLDKETMKKKLEEWFKSSYGLDNTPDGTSLCEGFYEIAIDKLEYQEG